MPKVKPILYMVGKGAISVLQTAIFKLRIRRTFTLFVAEHKVCRVATFMIVFKIMVVS